MPFCHASLLLSGPNNGAKPLKYVPIKYDFSMLEVLSSQLQMACITLDIILYLICIGAVNSKINQFQLS